MRPGLARDDIEYYLMHQATYKMMAYLYERLQLDQQRMPVVSGGLRQHGVLDDSRS